MVIQLANRQYLDEKSDGAVHQGIIARVNQAVSIRKTICRI
ncbi:RNA methyltransferase substrate-binding domain-containing protein [Escherichia coli]